MGSSEHSQAITQIIQKDPFDSLQKRGLSENLTLVHVTRAITQKLRSNTSLSPPGELAI